jgi:hypothetical protein
MHEPYENIPSEEGNEQSMFQSVSFEHPPCYPATSRGSLESLPFVHRNDYEDLG